MKVAISFIGGVVICLLAAIMVKPVIPVTADEIAANSTAPGGSAALGDLIPDFEKIYRESLTAPFVKARSLIYDPDIAAYYDTLMIKTGLTDPNSN